MSQETIELLLTRTDHPCPTCGALLYRVFEIIGKISIFLGLTCRSCEANGMRLLKEQE